jgi:oligoribonuclease NrnB/cAMP/cGMP phosphodiesterase (DHH superfamily)
MDLIIFHNKCPDGFCSAFIAKKRYPEAEILALDHGEPVPFEAVRGKDVLVLDFSWPVREDNIELHRIANSFYILDHHKSALERIGDLPFVTFDMKRSGAGITWDVLFGLEKMDLTVWNPADPFGELKPQPRPWYVNYVEDRDLWNHALPGTKAVNAYIMSLPLTIEAWQQLDLMKVEYAEQAGIGILRHVDRYVKEAVAEAQRGFIEIAEHKFLTVAVVNCPYMNCSEVGNVLAQTACVGVTWFERADNLVQFSLRSIGEIDVSEIAKTYLGGGHKHAAGFRLCIQDARELIDTILGRHDYNG